jgi:hypothetical protein
MAITVADVTNYVKQFNSSVYSTDDITAIIADATAIILNAEPRLDGDDELDQIVLKLSVGMLRQALGLAYGDMNETQAMSMVKAWSSRENLRQSTTTSTTSSGTVYGEGRLPSSLLDELEDEYD